jgi:uncharacterized membrane protein YqjE
VERPQVAEESTASILRGAIMDVGDIVKAELSLAKIEIAEDAKALGRTLPVAAVGTVLAGIGAALLLHAAAMLLGVVLPVWAGYLIVAAVAMGGAAVMLRWVFARLRDWKSFLPERTLASLEENEEWLRKKLT